MLFSRSVVYLRPVLSWLPNCLSLNLCELLAGWCRLYDQYYEILPKHSRESLGRYQKCIIDSQLRYFFLCLIKWSHSAYDQWAVICRLQSQNIGSFFLVLFAWLVLRLNSNDIGALRCQALFKYLCAGFGDLIQEENVFFVWRECSRSLLFIAVDLMARVSQGPGLLCIWMDR